MDSIANSTGSVTDGFEALPSRFPRFFTRFDAPFAPRTRKKRRIKRGAKHNRQRLYSQIYYVGLDVEWQRDPSYKDRNRIVSSQLAIVSRDRTASIIKMSEGGERLRLEDLVRLAIQSVNDGKVPPLSANKLSRALVVLVAHHTPAEWSSLADRDEPHIARRLTEIRGSVVTGNAPIELSLAPGYPVDVRLFDTRLLAPASHQSLKKLSALLGDEGAAKVEISQYHIENMVEFFDRHPDEARRYAKADSEIAVRLFFELQTLLNELVNNDKDFVPGTIKRLFRTLGSAGVAWFRKRNKTYAEYLKDLGLKPRGKSKNSPECPVDPRKFRDALEMARQSYRGGRNENYVVGLTSAYPETRDRLLVDVDFQGAYPSAQCLAPIIDVNGDIEIIPRSYAIDDRVSAELATDCVPPDIVDAARATLAKSPNAFDRFLRKNRLHAKVIRARATVVDNRLVDRWYATWQEVKGSTPSAREAFERFLTAGFAFVWFEYSETTMFPGLPETDYRFGQVYARQGEAFVTAIEVVQALEAGAKIEALASVEFPLLKDSEGVVQHFFKSGIGVLTRARLEEKGKAKAGDKKARLAEQLLKEFSNGHYGKVSQGINRRRKFDPERRETSTLPPSSISEPVTAALTTGLLRAALAAVLHGIEKHNVSRPVEDQIIVVSVTTDGALLGVPHGNELRASSFYVPSDGKQEMKLVADNAREVLGRLGVAGLLDVFEESLPVRHLRRSRIDMTGDQNTPYLEIKAIADVGVGFRTRGQIGYVIPAPLPIPTTIEGLLKTEPRFAVIHAKSGHKPPLKEIVPDRELRKEIKDEGGIALHTIETDWMVEQYRRAEEEGLERVETYTVYGLRSFSEMVKSSGMRDLTETQKVRTIGTGFDWKRRVQVDENGKTLPITLPHESLVSMRQYRAEADKIRRRKLVARPAVVLQQAGLRGQRVNFSGGEQAAAARLFLRGIMQRHLPTGQPVGSSRVIAEMLNHVWGQSGMNELFPRAWRSHDVKTAATRGAWIPGCIPRTSTSLRLIESLADAFGMAREVAVRAIFSSVDKDPVTDLLVDEVARAILCGPRDGVEPFRSLFRKGKLPTKFGLLVALSPRMTTAWLETCESGTFVRGRRDRGDLARLVGLFRLVGLSKGDAIQCAGVIAPLPKGVSTVFRDRRNPATDRILASFVLALRQKDVNTIPVPVNAVLDRLEQFGLTRKKYYALRTSRFERGRITDSPKNVALIRRMAKGVSLDPAPFIEAMVITS